MKSSRQRAVSAHERSASDSSEAGTPNTRSETSSAMW